jgi:hypothetical protein
VQHIRHFLQLPTKKRQKLTVTFSNIRFRPGNQRNKPVRISEKNTGLLLFNSPANTVNQHNKKTRRSSTPQEFDNNFAQLLTDCE